MELAIETARQMSFDEKARVRAMLNHSLGMSKLDFSDGTLSLLLKQGIPITRSNYLLLAFAGEVPEKLDGELEEYLVEIGVSNILPECKVKQ